MNFRKYNKSYNAIQSALLDNEIHKAHALMEPFIVDYAPDMEAASASLQQQEQALEEILGNSTKSDSSATSLSDLIDQVYAETWQLLDQIHWSVIEHKPLIFAVDDLEAELATERIATCNDMQLGCVFNTLRTTYPVTKAVRNALHECILSDQIPMFKRATLLSAVTLNVLEWFDADLLECMYTYTLDDQPDQLRQQSWTALCLCGMVHDARIMHHPRLREEYLLLCEEEPEQLRQLQKFILPLRDHGAFDRKLQQILGNMFTKVIERHQEKEEDDEDNEFRSQEEETFDEEGKAQVKSLIDLMTSSLDSGYNGFKRMCQTPFFQREGNEHHWLMPFTTEQEDIQRILTEHPGLSTWASVMKANLAQTNTDKYGTLVLMGGMPDSAMTQLVSKLGEMNIEADKLKDLGSDMLMMIHLQDFFRFFTLSTVGKKMRNPFELSPDLSTYRCFGTSLITVENLREVGAFLGKSERWSEAIDVFYRLLDKEFTQQNVHAFIASHIRYDRKKWDKRMEQVLERAFQMFPDDKRILNTIVAICDVHDPRSEANLREAVKQAPDNVFYLLRLGQLLNNLGRNIEALEVLYKANVLDEKDGGVLTELIKAHFLLGQFEKAGSLQKKVVQALGPKLSLDTVIEADLILTLIFFFEGNFSLAYSRLESAAEHNHFDKVYQLLGQYEEILGRRGIQIPEFAICKAQLSKLHARKQ